MCFVVPVTGSAKPVYTQLLVILDQIDTVIAGLAQPGEACLITYLLQRQKTLT